MDGGAYNDEPDSSAFDDKIQERLDYACQKVMGMPSLEFYNHEYASEEGFQMYPDTREVIKFLINTTLDCHKYEIYESYVPFVLTMIQFGRPYHRRAYNRIDYIHMAPCHYYFTYIGLFVFLRGCRTHTPFKIIPDDIIFVSSRAYCYDFDPNMLLESVKKEKEWINEINEEEESERVNIYIDDHTYASRKIMSDIIMEIAESMIK